MTTRPTPASPSGRDLDTLLRPPPGPVVPADVVTNLVTATHAQTRLEAGSTRQRSGRGACRWTVPVLLAGVFALTAAGTTSAYLLGVPPFQTLESGVERTTTGIPVDYTNYRGRPVHCLAFIEFADVTPLQRRQINDLTTSTDWTGYGQRIINTSPVTTRTTLGDDNHALESLGPDLTRRTLANVPGLTGRPAPHEPRVTGHSLSCTGPGGQDGAR